MTSTTQTLDHVVALLGNEARARSDYASALMEAAADVQGIINGIILAEHKAAESASKASDKESKVLLKSDTRKGVTHVVKVANGQATDCSCEHSTIRDAYCKHMRQVDYDIRYNFRNQDGTKAV
jgi:hypothetical protein